TSPPPPARLHRHRRASLDLHDDREPDPETHPCGDGCCRAPRRGPLPPAADYPESGAIKSTRGSGLRRVAGRAARDLLGREDLDALAEHPLLAERVAQAAAPLAVELIGERVDHLGA